MGNNRSAFVPEIANLPSLARKRTSARRSGTSSDPYAMRDVDMRSPRGRRYRDLVDTVIAEFGNANPTAIRELAGLRFTLEDVQAAVIGGSISAREDLVRLSNTISRRERELRPNNASKRDDTPDLNSYLAEHHGSDAA